MASSPADEDELTEMYDADFPRVDLVGKAANGIPRFLIAKSDQSAGLIDPETVRELIAKSEPDVSGRERVTMPTGVTLTGSPAAIAAFIHQAAVTKAAEDDTEVAEVEKADLSSKELNDLPDSAFAYIEPGGKKDAEGKTVPRSKRHFAIHDKSHADNAAARIAQGAKFGKEALPKVRAAQKQFGEDVSKEAAVADPETVAKDTGPDLDDGVDGLDPTVPLGSPAGTAPGDPTDPGSPAWEEIDAATAVKWTSILSRARVAIDMLADREAIEAVTADPGDAEHACDLQDVCCAIDYAISVLAPFAVSEQSEADTGAAGMVAKAMAGFDTAALQAVEGLGVVAKAGRVLSASNEASIRSAAANLNKVLATLPAAPQTDSGQPVAKKEADMPDQTKAADPVEKTAADPAETTEPEATEAAKAASDTPADAGAPETGTEPSGEDVTKAGDSPDAKAAGDAGDVMKSARAGLQVVVYDHDGTASYCPPEAITVQKADGAMVAVYDQHGHLVGIVAPDALTPVQAPSCDSDDDGEPGDGEGPDAADGTDMTPAPPADAGTPADDGPVAKQATEPENNTDALLKGLQTMFTEAVKAARGDGAPAEDVAKQADVAALTEVAKALENRLKVVEGQPAAPKVFTNGAVPPPGTLRGQDNSHGAAAAAVAKAAELRDQFRRADPAEQNRMATEMQAAAIDHLAVLHGRK